MFRRIDGDDRAEIEIFVEGTSVQARAGDTVSVALLASGRDVRRDTAVSGAKRLPYCMMGVCFDCLVVVDGVPGTRACMTWVREGMVVSRQDGAGVARQPEGRDAPTP